MKNRRVLRHFSKKYEHSMHKMMPPLTIGAATLSLFASVYGFEEAALDTSSWHFWASVFGIVTSVLSLAYGCYCMFAVWRTIQRGRGVGRHSASNEKLGAINNFVHDWYFSKYSLGHDSRAEFATDALMASDFLGQMQRDRTRTEQRRQVAAAVELLDVDPGAVTWHEDREFAAGGFSTVWRVRYCGEVVAAKVLTRPGAQSIHKAEEWLHGVKKEAAILHRLSACDNIINVLGIFERPDGAVVLMEYASGGTLRDYLHPVRIEGATFTGTGESASTGTGKSASTSNSTSSAKSASTSRSSASSTATYSSAGAAAHHSLPPLEQGEQLSILIDIARAMLYCYSQDPPVQHRWLRPVLSCRDSLTWLSCAGT
jgi:hypothetical protein